MRWLVACALLNSVVATTWYAAYDLSEASIAHATRLGCYRGAYGPRNGHRRLSLLTCPLFSNSPFARTEEDAFLCVLELKHEAMAKSAKNVIEGHATTKLLFEGEQELVIMDSAKPNEKPELCCPIHFDDTADNTLYVPTHPIRPQDPIPMWHPRVAALYNGTKLEPKPRIVELVGMFNKDNVFNNVVWLGTGNDGSPTTVTRNSFSLQGSTTGGCGTIGSTGQPVSRCAGDVAHQLVGRLEQWFANYTRGVWHVTLHNFRADMCPNVILEVEGRLDHTIVLTGAHLDARNTNSGNAATGEAPGADDNGSGSAIQMEMARIIGTQNQALEHSMRIMWFCGEEQGLLGSRALAISYREAGDQIIGMFNMDMIGYTRPGLPVVMSFMTGSASADLSAEIKAFSAIYVPTLQTGDTSACCSDQQSFFAEGFRAAGIFETPTPSVVYPEYHRIGDRHDNGLINYDQIWDFGKGLFSAILEYAQPIE
jgi:hypothetical protein